MSELKELYEIYLNNGIELEDKEIKRAFGNSLRKLREHINITQEELSKKTSVSRQTISVYEKGEITPTITNGLKLASFFNLTINDLIIYGLGAQEILNENISDITTKYDIENI